MLWAPRHRGAWYRRPRDHRRRQRQGRPVGPMRRVTASGRAAQGIESTAALAPEQRPYRGLFPTRDEQPRRSGLSVRPFALQRPRSDRHQSSVGPSPWRRDLLRRLQPAQARCRPRQGHLPERPPALRCQRHLPSRAGTPIRGSARKFVDALCAPTYAAPLEPRGSARRRRPRWPRMRQGAIRRRPPPCHHGGGPSRTRGWMLTRSITIVSGRVASRARSNS